MTGPGHTPRTPFFPTAAQGRLRDVLAGGPASHTKETVGECSPPWSDSSAHRPSVREHHLLSKPMRRWKCSSFGRTIIHLTPHANTVKRAGARFPPATLPAMSCANREHRTQTADEKANTRGTTPSFGPRPRCICPEQWSAQRATAKSSHTLISPARPVPPCVTEHMVETKTHRFHYPILPRRPASGQV